MKKVIGSLILLTMFVLNSALHAITADEVAIKASKASFYQGDDGKAVVSMSIKDQNGSSRSRQFVILRKDRVENKEQYYYVYFKKPSDVRKMVFMVWKNTTRDDDRWLYLPALDLVKRIAASDKRTSFVGSDFLYEDVSGRSYQDDVHEIISETDTKYVLRNTPKNKKSVEFAYYDVEIDKKTFLPGKAQYYKASGEKYREVEAVETKTIQGLPTITKMVAKNLESGSQTELVFAEVQYNLGFADKLFSERYLRRAPKEVR